MGTTPTYALPYPEATDPADVPTDIRELAEEVETEIVRVDAVLAGGLVPSVVTALPGSPVDGQEIYLKVNALVPASHGYLLWHLRYDAAKVATGPWVFLGGPPLIAPQIVADEAIPNTAALGDLATPGPDLTLPCAGWYTFRFGARIRNASAPGSGRTTTMGLSIAGAAPDGDATASWSFNTGIGGSSGAREVLLSVPSAGALVRAKYAEGTATPAADAFAAGRWLTAVPVALS